MRGYWACAAGPRSTINAATRPITNLIIDNLTFQLSRINYVLLHFDKSKHTVIPNSRTVRDLLLNSRVLCSVQSLEKIIPSRIYRLYQLYTLFATPSFDLFFAQNFLFGCRKFLKIDESIYVVSGS